MRGCRAECTALWSTDKLQLSTLAALSPLLKKWSLGHLPPCYPLGHPRNSISAELEFAFSPVGAPGVSNLRYPKLKLSTNEAQLVAFCLSSKTPPNAPQEPRLSWEVELRASTINAFNQVRTSSKLDFRKTCNVHLGPKRYPGGKSSSATALLPRLPCRTYAEPEF